MSRAAAFSGISVSVGGRSHQDQHREVNMAVSTREVCPPPCKMAVVQCMRPWLCTVAVVQQAPTRRPPRLVPWDTYLVDIGTRALFGGGTRTGMYRRHLGSPCCSGRPTRPSYGTGACTTFTAKRIAEDDEQGCDEGWEMMSRIADPSAVDGEICEMGV